jgi:ectoine hydroxylase-related dioxygenase (phytanoyl-CoA dioxygenase family)
MGLTEEQVRTFREEGVLVVQNVLMQADLALVIREVSDWIDRRARELAAEGKVTDLCEEAPFERRLALLYAQTSEISQGLDIMFARGPATFAFLHNPHLLDSVESIIGTEITCSPIQHIRAKPPTASSGEGAGFYNVPWHQDAGVTWEEADNSDIITCWIALTDATVENGCMEVMPGVWKAGYLEHQAQGGTTIRPDLLPNVPPRAVPVCQGGIVFMHRYTPHRSTPNYTDGVRWSIDLRYQPNGTPTGRPFHPDFVVRSRRHPESVLTDHAEWSRRWVDALASAKGIQAHRVK